MRANPEGFEKSILKSWDGWDGDLDMMQFYDIELQDGVYRALLEKGILNHNQSGILKGYTATFHLNNCLFQLFNSEGKEICCATFACYLKDITVDPDE